MSQLADNTIVFLPESETIVQQNPLPNELDERPVKLIEAAEERIHSMRNKADTKYAKREQRLGKFDPHLVIDPVMGTSFPKYMPVEKRRRRGQTLRFSTDESFRKFSENASYYLGVNFDPLVTEFSPSFDSFRPE
jgi:YHS domain-containing protein